MTVRRLNRHGLSILLDLYGASLVAQMGKSVPAMQETWVQSLGWKDPLEKEVATRSSFLAWRIPWTEELGGPSSMGSQRIGYMTKQLTHYLMSSSPKPFLYYCTSPERLKSHLAERTPGRILVCAQSENSKHRVMWRLLTHGKLQCAAVITQRGWIRTPTQGK